MFFAENRSTLLGCIILTMSVRKQTLFLNLTTAVIFLSIIYNLSIMSSSVVCIFALLYVYITNNEYSIIIIMSLFNVLTYTFSYIYDI